MISAGRGGRGGSGSSLFGPDDWNCGMCGNTNWAKRAACNVCNTARPGGAVDRREGLAGGFKVDRRGELGDTKKGDAKVGMNSMQTCGFLAIAN